MGYVFRRAEFKKELLLYRLKNPTDRDIIEFGIGSEKFIGEFQYKDYGIDPNDWPDDQRPDIHPWFTTKRDDSAIKVWVVIGQVNDFEDFPIPSTYWIKCVGFLFNNDDIRN